MESRNVRCPTWIEPCRKSFPYIGNLSDQYRATTTIAAINSAAITDSARSSVFERGLAVGASKGDMSTLKVIAYSPGFQFLRRDEAYVGGFSSLASQP